MAVRTTITNKGLQLLASSSQATGQYYWLGYYALAYVPDFWKTVNPTIDFPDPDCFKVNAGDTISADATDPVTPTMQRLTTNGDMVWNVWQGDLTGTGFINESDGTPGGNLFGLTMYAKSVKKHYRYVLDENGNNLLVCWINKPTSTTGEMEAASVYYGTDGFVESELPIPAPIYYIGDVTGKFSVNDFFPDFIDPDENGASIYPFIDVPMTDTITYPTGIIVPKVSADYRGYLDTLGNGALFDYGATAPHTGIPVQYFDETEIPASVSGAFDVTSWYAADLTYSVPENAYNLMHDPAKFDTEMWKLATSSNYNRWHAPVDNIGFLRSSDLSNRNMAKTTKFFPISNYKTINTESSFTSNGESLEVATAIQLTIDLDISPSTLTDGSDVSTITSFDKYENADLTPNQSPQDQFDKSVFISTHSSFKFNRVGIYAVPLRKHPYAQDQGFGYNGCGAGNAVDLQFQIDPDEEPVLFAVMDWDNTVTLDDTGNGISAFHAEVNVNLESPDGSVDTALIRDSSIFYNLYEDDALKWYENQLIANAQTQNAITELGLEVGSLLQKEGNDNCCPTPDLSNLYAAKNHTHTGLGLRNLKDSRIVANNGLRGISTIPETTDINGTSYELGFQSVALGLDTVSGSDNSTVAGGNGNQILFDGLNNFIGSGLGNKIQDLTSYAFIGAGELNELGGEGSFIGAGNSNNITNGAVYSSIVTGTNNTIDGGVAGFISIGSFIAAGTGNLLWHSYQSMIGAGNNNEIYVANASVIAGGKDNKINGTLTPTTVLNASFISAGLSNTIQANTSFIGSGVFNLIDGDNISHASITSGNANHVSDSFSGIVNGFNNYIKTGTHAFIGSGAENLIADSLIFPTPSNYSVIVGGYDNTILSSTHAIIGGGELNFIDGISDRSGIFSGVENTIATSTHSVIGGGEANDITGLLNNVISGGYSNTLKSSTKCFIGGGASNRIEDNTGFIQNSVIGGGYNNYITSYGGGSTNNYVFIGGGAFNEITNGNYSSILGGYFNKVLNASYATVIGGIDTTARYYGEVTHSSGEMRVSDNIRHSTLMARNAMDAGTAEGTLYLDGTSEQIVFPATSDGYVSGSITVTAFTNDLTQVTAAASYMSRYIFTAAYDSANNYINISWAMDTANSLTFMKQGEGVVSGLNGSVNQTGNTSSNLTTSTPAVDAHSHEYATVINPMQTDSYLTDGSGSGGLENSMINAFWMDGIDNTLSFNVSKSNDYISSDVDISGLIDVVIYEKNN